MKSGKIQIPSAAAIGLVVLLIAIVFSLWPFVAAGQTSFVNCRFGFAAMLRDPSDYSDIGRLQAGWYHRFRTELNPTRPEGMEHVQMVRLHQSKESPCGAYTSGLLATKWTDVIGRSMARAGPKMRCCPQSTPWPIMSFTTP